MPQGMVAWNAPNAPEGFSCSNLSCFSRTMGLLKKGHLSYMERVSCASSEFPHQSFCTFKTHLCLKLQFFELQKWNTRVNMYGLT